MTLSLIVALAENGTIGRDGQLPWRLPDDLRRFKQLTLGHTLIMGRKTFESIGRVLPGRTTLVLTRQADWSSPGVTVARDLDQALAVAGGDPEPFVVGGADIYRLALPRADRLYVTQLQAAVAGDTYFPPIDAAEWELIEESAHPADERHAFPFLFRVFARRGHRSPLEPTDVAVCRQ